MPIKPVFHIAEASWILFATVSFVGRWSSWKSTLFDSFVGDFVGSRFVQLSKAYMSPRSILKHPGSSGLSHNPSFPEPFPFAECPTVQVSPHVHFPPTPTLTSIFITHSPSTYDRSSAEVLPNNCALPGRHERELTEPPYSYPSSSLWGVDDLKGSYFHPRAFEASSIEPSESDDSDTIRTPPEPSSYTPSISVHYTSRNTSHLMMPYALTQADIDSALSFLPHAPSSPTREKCRTRRSQQQQHHHHHHQDGRNHHSKKSREESADGRIRDRTGGFMVPSLDSEGCLGGF